MFAFRFHGDYIDSKSFAGTKIDRVMQAKDAGGILYAVVHSKVQTRCSCIIQEINAYNQCHVQKIKIMTEKEGDHGLVTFNQTDNKLSDSEIYRFLKIQESLEFAGKPTTYRDWFMPRELATASLNEIKQTKEGIAKQEEVMREDPQSFKVDTETDEKEEGEVEEDELGSTGLNQRVVDGTLVNEMIVKLQAELDAFKQERDALIQEKQAWTNERDALVHDKQTWARERETLIQEKKNALNARDLLSGDVDRLMQERDTAVKRCKRQEGSFYNRILQDHTDEMYKEKSKYQKTTHELNKNCEDMLWEVKAHEAKAQFQMGVKHRDEIFALVTKHEDEIHVLKKEHRTQMEQATIQIKILKGEYNKEDS